jgi:hypothetical protein
MITMIFLAIGQVRDLAAAIADVGMGQAMTGVHRFSAVRILYKPSLESACKARSYWLGVILAFT